MRARKKPIPYKFMPLIKEHTIGILPISLKPGDIALKMNQQANLGPGWDKWGSRSIIANIISGLSGCNPEYVHGGLCVGQGRLVEVNGNLRADNVSGSRFFANIYLTEIARDTATVSYDVWRCTDTELAQEVAIQAYPFVYQGALKSWGYNLGDALSSVGLTTASRVHSHGPPGAASGKPEKAPVGKKPDALDIAISEGRRFFCTQFIVWLYNVVSFRILGRGRNAIPLNDELAYPGMLAEVLHNRSSNFIYVGCIRGAHKASDTRKLF